MSLFLTVLSRRLPLLLITMQQQKKAKRRSAMVNRSKKLMPSPTAEIKLWEEDPVFSSLLMSYSRTPHPLVLIAFCATKGIIVTPATVHCLPSPLPPSSSSSSSTASRSSAILSPGNCHADPIIDHLLITTSPCPVLPASLGRPASPLTALLLLIPFPHFSLLCLPSSLFPPPFSPYLL